MSTPSEAMDRFGPNNKYYEYNRRLLSLIGLWPFEQTSERLFRVYFILFAMVNICAIQMYLVLTTQLKLEALITQLQMLLPTMCFLFCYYSLVGNSKTLKIILNHMENDWAQLRNEEELNSMEKYANQSRLCSIVISCICYSYVSFLIFPAFWSISMYSFGVYNDTQLELPITIEYFLKNKMRYFIMLVMQLLSIYLVCIVGVSYYSLFVTFTQHACALFNIVTIKMHQPFKKSTHDFCLTSSTAKHGNEFDWIVTVMTYYDEAVNFVNLLQLVFDGTYLVKVTLSLIFIFIDFIYLFQMLDFVLPTTEALTNGIFAIANIFLIYAISCVGQRLIDHSFEVYKQTCQIPFYTLSVTTQKNLLLFIKRSLKPCRYSLNGIIVSSYETFAKLVNISYSLAMLCYNMH